MKRYAAFLRGVSPMNAKMPELVRAFERGGFRDVRTVLASGNVVFSARAAAIAKLERACEAAMEREVGRTFATIVRPIDHLRALLDADPFRRFRISRSAKRVVTFVRRAPSAPLRLPVVSDGARILLVDGGEVFTAYVPSPRGAVFMTLLEKTFGKDITTRTWETVQKVAHPRLDP